jgi:hypothetical protein
MKKIIRESTILFFGTKADPEVKESIRKAKMTGRKTDVQPRPSYDTGTGQCGKHLCHCKTVCMKQFDGKAFEADQAPTIGMSY